MLERPPALRASLLVGQLESLDGIGNSERAVERADQPGLGEGGSDRVGRSRVIAVRATRPAGLVGPVITVFSEHGVCVEVGCLDIFPMLERDAFLRRCAKHKLTGSVRLARRELDPGSSGHFARYGLKLILGHAAVKRNPNTQARFLGRVRPSGVNQMCVPAKNLAKFGDVRRLDMIVI